MWNIFLGHEEKKIPIFPRRKKSDYIYTFLEHRGGNRHNNNTSEYVHVLSYYYYYLGECLRTNHVEVKLFSLSFLFLFDDDMRGGETGARAVRQGRKRRSSVAALSHKNKRL